MNGKSREERRDRESLRSSGLTMPVDSRGSLRGQIHFGNLVSLIFMKRQLTRKLKDISINKASKSMTSGCLIPRSKGLKQPKSGSPENMVNEQKIPQSGLFTPESRIGSLVAKRESKEGNRWSVRPPNSSFILNLSFCLFLTFAATLTNITVASHNLHSFKKSGAYHKACVERHGGLWMGQELWLSEKQLPMLQQLGSQFVARSGMEDAASGGIMLGRPFGGVSITWSPDLNHLISPISNFRHKRIVGVELKS